MEDIRPWFILWIFKLYSDLCTSSSPLFQIMLIINLGKFSINLTTPHVCNTMMWLNIPCVYMECTYCLGIFVSVYLGCLGVLCVCLSFFQFYKSKCWTCHLAFCFVLVINNMLVYRSMFSLLYFYLSIFCFIL